MRKWFKYYLDSSINGRTYDAIDQTFEEHAKAMGGYNADESYRGKSDFFNKHFFNYHQNRLEYYDKFLRKHLKREDNVLSVASGRCANELFLMEDGYKIACSDLEIFDAYQKTRTLFPNLHWIKLNILESSSPSKYNAVICLSLIYLFDEGNLLLFFKNISDSLKTGGHLILDSPGSPDNLLSFLIHDVFLKYETLFIRIAGLILSKKSMGFVIKHHGYRRTDREIIKAAQQYGLELENQENYAFLTEFRRSYLFNRIIRPNSRIEKIFSTIGKNVPYIRMYNFKKIV